MEHDTNTDGSQRREVSQPQEAQCAQGEHSQSAGGSGVEAKTRYAFQKVADSRGERVRGLWQRGSVLYAQLAVRRSDGTTRTRRVRLKSKSVCEAVHEQFQLRQGQKDGQMITCSAPEFGTVVESYLRRLETTARPATLKSVTSCLARARRVFGTTRVDRVSLATLEEFQSARVREGIAASTINTEVRSIGAVLSYAMDRTMILANPARKLKPLKEPFKERNLITQVDIDELCMNAVERPNFVDYVRLLQFTGAREQEALRLRWIDVEYSRKRLKIGGDGLAKNSTWRYVDFSPSLESHLNSMHSRRSESAFMFPHLGGHVKSYRDELNRFKVGTAIKGFHCARHMFASRCIMSGIDAMTVAKWLGHADSGVLVMRTYGHLTDAHRLNQAAKLTF